MGLELTFWKEQKSHNQQAYINLKKEPVSVQNNFEEQPFVILQKLRNVEVSLMEEKENLTSLREELQLRLQKKIRRKQKSIKKLRAEIKDLKFSCNEFSKSFRQAHN
jgi:uncharacterized protein YlxW (UPF0749 family)